MEELRPNSPIHINSWPTSDFDIVSENDEVDKCYGMETFHISLTDIAALMQGKALYSTIMLNEYAIKIEYDAEEQI